MFRRRKHPITPPPPVGQSAGAEYRKERPAGGTVPAIVSMHTGFRKLTGPCRSAPARWPTAPRPVLGVRYMLGLGCVQAESGRRFLSTLVGACRSFLTSNSACPPSMPLGLAQKRPEQVDSPMATCRLTNQRVNMDVTCQS